MSTAYKVASISYKIPDILLKPTSLIRNTTYEIQKQEVS